MAKILMHYTCCLIVLTSCVDQGDGRWKKKEKENLQHDLKVFKNMAEKIEQEIELFYEDYSDEQTRGDDIEKINQQYRHMFYRKTRNGVHNPKDKTHNFTYIRNNNLKKNKNAVTNLNHLDNNGSNIHVSFTNTIDDVNYYKDTSSNWPKFEDILLAMGRRYDWKNDRWIKVKRKVKESKTKVLGKDNSISFHEKHKFRYRTVKLNRGKSRRNVVIAVSAIR